MPHNPQLIVTPNGEEMVVLSRSEYERLAELASDAEEYRADIEAYDLAKAELAAAGSTTLPKEVSDFLLKGSSLLQSLRKWRGLTQVDLAEKVGIQQGYLSDLENKRRAGSPETLALLAKALDVPLEWIA